MDVEKMAASIGEAHIADELKELHAKKLWHQLTDKLYEYAVSHHATSSNNLVVIYESFIMHIEKYLSVLPLTYIVILTSHQITEFKAKSEFLARFAGTVSKYPSAFCLCQTKLARHLLDSNQHGAIEECKRILKDLRVDVEVHGRIKIAIMGEFYKLSADLHQRMGKYSKYYYDALRYLGCIESQSVNKNEKSTLIFPNDTEVVTLGYSLCAAAILSNNVFNLGELVTHPIMRYIEASSFSWIKGMIETYNSGDVVAFQANFSNYVKSPLFEGKQDRLKSKFSVMCLLNLCFHRLATNRTITFNEIAQKSNVQVDQVEGILIWALSKKIIRASINQVDQTVDITWVLSRVLTADQVQCMAAQLQAWVYKVDQTLSHANQLSSLAVKQ